GGLAGAGHRASGQTGSAAARRGGGASAGTRHGRAGAAADHPDARGRGVEHGLHRAAECHLPCSLGGVGAPDAGHGAARAAAARRDVPDRHALQLLHLSRQPHAGHGPADGSDGGGYHPECVKPHETDL
ncbi:MAG: hypothetical protein AVDCRST_MAG26-1748, partial [uncultured Chloroflexia bacterium]